MRSAAYIVAALAAVGIVIAIASVPLDDSNESAPAAQSVAQDRVADSTTAGGPDEAAGGPDGAAGSKTLVLHVPDMHCPFACYPAVKETLESDPSVAGVDLVEQKEEGVIDNPSVVVTYADGFDLDVAVAALAKQGFKNAAETP